MADLPIFPKSLPMPESSSLQWTPLFDNVIRSDMDFAVKARRRATYVPKTFTCTLYPTAAQLETLLDFYEITLGAVRRFRWYDFRRPSNTVELATYSFSAEPAPQAWEDIYSVGLTLIQWTTVRGRNLLTTEVGDILTTQGAGLTT